MAVPETMTVFMIQRRTSDSVKSAWKPERVGCFGQKVGGKARISASVFNAEKSICTNGIKKAIAIGARIKWAGSKGNQPIRRPGFRPSDAASARAVGRPGPGGRRCGALRAHWLSASS